MGLWLAEQAFSAAVGEIEAIGADNAQYWMGVARGNPDRNAFFVNDSGCVLVPIADALLSTAKWHTASLAKSD